MRRVSCLLLILGAPLACGDPASPTDQTSNGGVGGSITHSTGGTAGSSAGATVVGGSAGSAGNAGAGGTVGGDGGAAGESAGAGGSAPLACASMPPDCAGLAAVGDAPPVILHATESAGPGGLLSLQGSRFGSSPEVQLRAVSHPDTPPLVLSVVSASAAQLVVEIPATVPLDVYAVQVRSGPQLSAPAWVNRPRSDFVEFDEVTPGTVFRVFGRNLATKDAPSAAWLVGSDGTTLPASVLAADEYRMQLRAPDEVKAGVSYQVALSNGLGCACGGGALASEALTGRAASPDPLGLKVPWAGEFDYLDNVYNVRTDVRLTAHAVGDGKTDDTVAVRDAINRAAQDKGGVVYLPAGTYRVNQILMRPRVLLRGESKDKTLIEYGFVTVNPGDPSFSFVDGAHASGFSALAVHNVSTESNPHRVTSGIFGTPANHVVLRDLDINVGIGGAFFASNTDHILIDHVRVQTEIVTKPPKPIGGEGIGGGLVSRQNHYLTMRDSEVHWVAHAMSFDYNDHMVVESSQFLRNADYHLSENTRGITLNFSDRVALLDSTIAVTGDDQAAAQGFNDGEAILSEGGGGDRHDASNGAVTSATATTLVDAKQTWPAPSKNSPPLPVRVVMISGAGAGQWRTETAHEGNTLTVDRPWDVTPAPGDQYVRTNWGAVRWFLDGNTLSNHRAGIEFYDTSTLDCVVARNKLTDANGISMSPVQHVKQAGITPVFDTLFAGNTVTDTTGQRPAYMGIFARIGSPSTSLGLLAAGIELRDNSLLGHTPHPKDTIEGFLNYTSWQITEGTASAGTEAILSGTLFTNNRVEQGSQAFSVGAGSYNTVIRGNTIVSADKPLEDLSVSQATSVGTVVQ